MKCDACGAPVENGKCSYCGKTFITADVPPQQQVQPQTTVVNNVYTNPQTVVVREKKKGGFGRVLLWIFFLPIMATIAVWKSNWKTWVKILVTALIWLFVIGYGAENSSDSASTSSSSSSSTAVTSEASKSEPAKAEESAAYSIGDTANVGDIEIKLSSAILSKGDGSFAKPDDGKYYLGLIFDIVNNTKNDITVSSLACFESYCDDYITSMDLFGASAPEWDGLGQLDGTIAAGKRMNGKIVYQVPVDFNEFEIRVKPSFWSGKEVTFTFSADQVDSSSVS